MLGDADSIPAWGTKIPHVVMQPKDKKINKIFKKKVLFFFFFKKKRSLIVIDNDSMILPPPSVKTYFLKKEIQTTMYKINKL